MFWAAANLSPFIALSLAPRSNRRPCQPELPHQDRTRYDDVSIQIPRWHYRSDGFESNGGQLDCESDGQESHRDQQLFTGYNGWWCCCEFTFDRLWLHLWGLRCAVRDTYSYRMIGLSILASILGNAMSTARTPTQAPYLRGSRVEDPGQPRLFIQGNGLVDGYDVCWCYEGGRSGSLLHRLRRHKTQRQPVLRWFWSDLCLWCIGCRIPL